MGIGYSIFIVAATIVAFLLYENVNTERRESYFRRSDLTEEERRQEVKASWSDRIVIITRLAIYATSAVFAFFGDILGIILAVFFTVEGIAHIYFEAASADKSKAAAWTFLSLPFAAVCACAIGKIGSLILGIIIGVVLVVGVRFASKIIDLLKGSRANTRETATNETRTEESEATEELPRRRIRTQGGN